MSATYSTVQLKIDISKIPTDFNMSVSMQANFVQLNYFGALAYVYATLKFNDLHAS